LHCIVCHNSLILNLNPKTQAKRWLLKYNTTNGIAGLRKHVNSDHCKIFKEMKKKWIILWGKMKGNLPKRDQTCFLVPYLFLFVAKDPFKKDDLK
jgi:hypothetical protein